MLDALLYAGTVRENLSVEGDKSDAELNDALRRAGLIGHETLSGVDKERFAKFKLDAMVSDDGSNFSAGEKQLLALCRVSQLLISSWSRPLISFHAFARP